MPSKHAKTAQRRRQRKAKNLVHPDSDGPPRRMRTVPGGGVRTVRATSTVPVIPTLGIEPTAPRIDTQSTVRANAPRPPLPPTTEDRRQKRHQGSRPNDLLVKAKQEARRGAASVYGRGGWREARTKARDAKRGPPEDSLW